MGVEASFDGENIQDQWRWLLDPIHGYTVCDAYRFLTTIDDQVAAGVLKDVWHKLVPFNVSLFAWCIFQDRIPTRSNLVCRHVLQPSDNVCVGGCGS
uniref:H+-transporting two-sector ATPase, alpha/beta subunit, central region, related n=1 Tax=Medicago truncatula TaxID=3880 RepID=A2Q4X6_MEDTR|nr:H+-transporting two-sector ATPase, alpha/beta subunit, central region, related [Medicago truncatula]